MTHNPQLGFKRALKNVTAPVLVIHGANDLQSERASRTYVEAFANAQFRVIDDAAHFLFHAQPEVFARVVAEFLSEQ